jgi:dTDP-4-dehydrorhamnose reductase
VKTLITGAGGMLGSALVPALVAAGHEVYATDLRGEARCIGLAEGAADSDLARLDRLGRLDVRCRADVDAWVERVWPDLVLHLAAETDVDRCEAEPDHAFATNALGTKHVALACQAANLPLVYISTAGVFDGAKDEPYTEYDPASPINVYGASKLEGERYVQTFLQRYYVVRAGWMVGGGDRDHKFVAKILSQLRHGARTVYAVGDRWGTPTYAPDFARCLARLIETDSYGLYHMACLGRGTRYDVARKILEVLGIDREVELVEVESAYFQDSFPAPRPRSEMMRNLLLDLQGLNTMRHWEDTLAEYLTTTFAELPGDVGGCALPRPDPVESPSLVAEVAPALAASSNGRGHDL